MKKNFIGLHGAYYDNNFGDLLLMKIYEKWIREVTESIIVYPSVPKDSIKKFKTHFPEAHIGLREILSWRALIYAGGGHFGEPDVSAANVYTASWSQRFFKRHVLPAELCMWTGIPFAIMGVGAGPLSNSFVRLETKRIFNSAKTLCVRDIESQKFVTDVLNLKRSIKVIPDAALSLSHTDIPEEASNAIQKILSPYQNANLLGIHHPRDFLRNTSQSEAVRTSLLNCLKTNCDIVPVVFADNGKNEYSEACEKLATLIRDHTGRECLSVPFIGVWEIVSLISNLSAVMTTKLHVGIVAYALGIYSESFAIHSKVKRFYQQINRSSQCSMLRDIDREISIGKINNVIQAANNQISVMDEDWYRVHQESILSRELVKSFLLSAL